MIHEYQVKVKAIHKETIDSVCITLDIPDNLKQQFVYKQGQSLTFIRDFNGEELRRCYSICSSVNDAEIRVGIKQIENGRFSTWANNQLKLGNTLKVLPPSGHFYVELDVNSKRHYVGIAAGSGITPILSILKTTLETESKSIFTLIYGNKTTETTMFLEELNKLKNRYTKRLHLFHVLSRETQNMKLLNGRIDSNKIKQFMETLIPAEKIDDVFLCGPFEMVMSAQDTFMATGIDKKHIHTELFNTPEDLKAIEKYNPELSTEQLKYLSKVQIIVDEKNTEINLARDGECILDAALKVHKELPFACKGGICATCKAKVMEGTVKMDLNYSLSEEEVEEGFILTCQSHPISDRVIVSFDQG